jgi:hypothetical protein
LNFPNSVVRFIAPFISISNAIQAAQVYDLSTTGAFRFCQATESAFLTAVEPRDISLQRRSLCTFVVEAHLEFHVPEPGILKSIEFFIYALVRPTELSFQTLDFRNIWCYRGVRR